MRCTVDGCLCHNCWLCLRQSRAPTRRLSSRLDSPQDDSITCLSSSSIFLPAGVWERCRGIATLCNACFFSALSRCGNPAGVPSHFVKSFKTVGKPNLTRCKRERPGYLIMFINGLLTVAGELAGYFGET